MKRGIAVLLALSALAAAVYFTADKWAIRHETITFYDPSRDNRPVPVGIAVRWDQQMQADAGMIKLPVAVLNHGDTLKHIEYGFLANVFAWRGYLVLSPQHDLPTDPTMMTKVGELYVGRLRQIQSAIADIHFVVDEMKKFQPNADYSKLTMVGRSMGDNISAYFARAYPDEIKTVVNVPFLNEGKFNIPSFRSNDPQFKADPGVVPDPKELENAGITTLNAGFQHNDIRDTPSDDAKKSIQDALDEFLRNTDSEIAPADTKLEKPQEGVAVAPDRGSHEASGPPLPTTPKTMVNEEPRRSEGKTSTSSPPERLEQSAQTKVEKKKPSDEILSGYPSGGPGAIGSAMRDRIVRASGDAKCHERLRQLGVISSNGPCEDLSAIVDDLAKGTYSFNKPKVVNLGEQFRLRLILQTAKDQPTSFAGLTGTVERRENRPFAQSIEATLTAEDFEVVPTGPQPRIATFSQPVEWEWRLKPTSAGTKTLTLDVAANIQVGVDKHRVQIATLHESIEIYVTLFQRLQAYLADATGMIVAFAAVVTPLAALIGFVPKLRKFLKDELLRFRRHRAHRPKKTA